ncbi:MAG: hypothetical protein DDT37_01679 [Firmicutes bacterium]|nr:hypothetical protein [candidate division NPL-UPA2 bacterium]
MENFARHHADFLSVIGLHQRAEHLLRRFTGGQVIEHLRVEVLRKLNPAGTAGRNQGQVLALVQPPQKFVPFFHNREVRAKLRIKNLVKA